MKRLEITSVFKKTLSLALILTLLCLLSLIFETQINHFLFENIGSWAYAVGFFIAGLYVCAFYSWVDLSQTAETLFNYDQLITARLIIILSFASIVIFIWSYQSKNIFEAISYSLQDFAWLRIIFILCFTYFCINATNLSKDSDISKNCLWAIAILHLWSAYYYYGGDDGCRAVGGDRMFGGADYYECDDEYEQQKEQAKKIANSNSFNSDALFTAQLFFDIIAAVTAILLRFVKHFFEHLINKNTKTEEIVAIVQAFGRCVENTLGKEIGFFDEKALPHSKTCIRQALVQAIKMSDNNGSVDAAKMALLTSLPMFQKGIGDEPITLSNFSGLNSTAKISFGDLNIQNILSSASELSDNDRSVLEFYFKRMEQDTTRYQKLIEI